VDIRKAENRKDEFKLLNPNAKIPAIVDPASHVRVFESGSILLYLAEKYHELIPSETQYRVATLNWYY